MAVIEEDLKQQAERDHKLIQELGQRCTRLQEELRGSMAEDGAVQERTGQLQVLNTQLLRKVEEQENEVVRLRKVKAELVQEREGFLRERLEHRRVEEQQREELLQVKYTNEQLDRKCLDLLRKL